MPHDFRAGSDGPEIDSICLSPEASELAARLLWLSHRCTDVASLLSAALPAISAALDVEYVGVVAAESGRWSLVSDSGQQQPLPLDLLADVLDRETACHEAPWIASPLTISTSVAEVLLLRHTSQPLPDSQRELFEAASVLCREAVASVRQGRRREKRIDQLEAILEIAGHWNQTNEMEPLLVEMAETSTRLLGAQRASIFLWDRLNRTLVGRPALGVHGNELRIPDDRGIVGQVVQTGEPRRATAEIDSDEIDRQVDKQLGFQTNTLLCVPLRGKSGKLFGAFELINKTDGNFTQADEEALVELAAHAAIALENTREYQQLLTSRRQMADEAAQGVKLVGESPAIDALRSTVRRVAGTELAVLILGESGTGKEVVAQAIHYMSPRRDEPIIAVNCAALTETLLESELFGHEKGAFTDAHQTRAGKFELASGGTLFLDEIGDLSLSGQSKLLRVLEEKIVVHVGGSTPIHADARVIAATNQDLAEMVRQKRFREDLYFRLNVVTLELPPLRDRADDVLLLAEHFLRQFCTQARRRFPPFTAAAKKRLRSHGWPGNVRELRNLMERLAYLSQGETVDADDLAFIFSPGDSSVGLMSSGLPLAEATREFQVEYIEKQMESARGNMTATATLLGLHRSNLYRKMRQLGMAVEKE